MTTVLQIIGSVLAAALLLWGYVWFDWRRSREPGFLSAGAQECARFYRRAVTAADTHRVDLMHPATGYQKDPNAPTCGTMRQVGTLPPRGRP